ncbi:MAG TPA: hypothetical protein VEF06_14325, partial [Bryobacteraceae bacterium]|nr:hypothetical protein [Bryobacteraceae bacterium]
MIRRGNLSGIALVAGLLAAPGAAQVTSLPHFAAGSTWTTDIYVVNTGISSANFQISFFDNNGNPVAVPFSSGSTTVLSGSVAAQGSAFYEAGNPKASL